MTDNFGTELLTDLVGRIDGPMHFRIYLQPLMATIFAVRDGLADARAGRPAYGWTLLTDAGQRQYMFRDGWKGIRNVFLMAWMLDVVYQFRVLGELRPLQAISMALLLAAVPYVLLRGPANRLVRGFVER